MKPLRYIDYNLKFLMLLIGIHFVAIASVAQNQLLIRGVVKNEVTQLPIEGANIQLQNTYTGTSTNNHGEFELRVDKFPVVLTITHISFYGKQTFITQTQADSIVIFLIPKTITLPETSISAETYKVFKGKGQEIIDYNFLDTNLLVLSYNFDNNRYELILTNESFDTVNIKNVSDLVKPNKIFKDCMGNCHLLTNDSAYQVYVLNETISFIYATHLPKFLKLLGNCLFETQTHLAFEGNTDEVPKLEYAAKGVNDVPSKKSNNEKWKHLFYLVNKETHKKVILDNIYEWKKNRDAFEQAVFRYSSPMNRMSFGEILRSEELIFYQPSFQTVRLLNDTIYYFNHLKSQIDIYSVDLDLIKSVKVEYHNNENWIHLIVTDDIKNKVYTIFTVGALYSLVEINLGDGSVNEVAKITKLFPQKIKVNNGHLYFLYNDLTNIWVRRRLFKGELLSY